MIKKIFIIFTMATTLFSQSELMQISNNPNINTQIATERYTTSIDGDIMININIWGHVTSPGSYTVPDGIDLISLFSTVGGPLDESNLSKIRLYRESPDSNGISLYFLDMNPFIKSGDRSNFLKIKPNDTIIINQKKSSYFIEKLSSINSIISLTTIVIQLFNIFN